MHVTARPYLTAGVALVGASAISLAPAVVPPSSTFTSSPAVSSVAVELSAAVNPITAWVDVFAGAATNLGGIGTAILEDPFPLLRQALENVLGYGGTIVSATSGAINGALQYISFDNEFGLWAQLGTAATQLFEGNIAGAFNTVTDALILGPIVNIGLPVFTSGLLEIPGKIADNVANLVKAVTSLDTLLPLVLGAVGPVMGTLAATGETFQAAFDSLTQGNLIDAVVTLINLPATVIGAALNGYTKADDTFIPGLFTFSENPGEAGLLQALFVTLPKALAAAIAPEEEMATVAAEGPADPDAGSGTMITVAEVSQTETVEEADAAAVDAGDTTVEEVTPAVEEVTPVVDEVAAPVEDEVTTPVDEVTEPVEDEDTAPVDETEEDAEAAPEETDAADDTAGEDDAAEGSGGESESSGGESGGDE
ncbi:hypothetical protein [Mycolicibacterium austroafricanum]|uniref:hypothetical protein n=1 Tax=Mycolicibacterium austroafricanum TaxID=39687 RepID=UPI001CA321CF|nr:hypothetical protein [Mycolicibacterium austroafricanum]QZT55662.1 hypothetical protein JN084_22330 [Mycolicibacterium austroafricanum]